MFDVDTPKNFESLEGFARTLEKLKLPTTAEVFRKELSKKNNLSVFQKSLAKNPLVKDIMLKLEGKKIDPRIKGKRGRDEKNREEEEKSYGNAYLNCNKSIVNSNVFRTLLNNFDNHQISTISETRPKLILVPGSTNSTNINNASQNDSKSNNKNSKTSG